MDSGTSYRQDIVIIGAGIVGLSIALQVVKGGAKVTVVDRDPEGDKVSLGNAGGIAVQEFSGDEARDREPALGPIVKGGVFTPQWSQISDPKRIVDGLRRWLVAQGVSFVRGDVATVVPTHEMVTLRLNGGTRLRAHKVVIAAGVWSKQLARQLGDRVLVESERGYNTTIANTPIVIRQEVIFADRKFVVTPLACGLRIGGTAEFGGLKAKPNFERCKMLVKLASLYFPQLDRCEGVEWSGHRPTTRDSLPVIGPSASSKKVIYAFGHGHLGLTQAATTASLVGELLTGRLPSIDLAPFSISRFAIQPGGNLNGTPDVFLH